MKPRRQSPHFFARENDGSVRLRIRFKPDEATLIERAAGGTPVMLWIHQAIAEAAQRDAAAIDAKRQAKYPTPK